MTPGAVSCFALHWQPPVQQSAPLDTLPQAPISNVELCSWRSHCSLCERLLQLPAARLRLLQQQVAALERCAQAGHVQRLVLVQPLQLGQLQLQLAGLLAARHCLAAQFGLVGMSSSTAEFEHGRTVLVGGKCKVNSYRVLFQVVQTGERPAYRLLTGQP